MGSLRRLFTRDAVDFRWQAPAGCPAEDEVQALIERKLGEPLAARTAPHMTIDVSVRKQADGDFGVEMWTTDEDGSHQRSLVDSDCNSAAAAAALIVATAINVRMREESVRESLAEPVAEQPRVAAIPSRPPEDRGARPPGRARFAPRGALRLSAGAVYGDLPKFGPLLRASAAMLARRWRIEAEFSYSFGRIIRYQDSDRRFQLITALVRMCPVFRVSRVEFPLCLGGEMGSMVARGGPIPGGVARGFFASVHASTGVMITLGPRIALSLALVEGSFHALRPLIIYSDEPYVPSALPGPSQVGAVGVRILSGIEFRFP